MLYEAVSFRYRVIEVPATKVYLPAAEGYIKTRPFTRWWDIRCPIVLLGRAMRD